MKIIVITNYRSYMSQTYGLNNSAILVSKYRMNIDFLKNL